MIKIKFCEPLEVSIRRVKYGDFIIPKISTKDRFVSKDFSANVKYYDTEIPAYKVNANRAIQNALREARREFGLSATI
jgi:hypothetical protein